MTNTQAVRIAEAALAARRAARSCQEADSRSPGIVATRELRQQLAAADDAFQRALDVMEES